VDNEVLTNRHVKLDDFKVAETTGHGIRRLRGVSDLRQATI